MTTPSMERNVIYGLYCTCHNEGLRYVGQTTQGAAPRLKGHLAAVRYRESRGLHLSHSQNWMRKHGLDNIRVTVLESFTSPEFLDDAEKRWVEHFENLTNVKPGGDQPRGWSMPEGHSKGSRNPMYGKERSEWMARIRILRGPMSGENRRAAAERLADSRKSSGWEMRRVKGVQRSRTDPEFRRRMSQATAGEKNSQYGRTYTIEEKRRMSLACSPFTEDDIRDIRARSASGDRNKNIASAYGVDPSTISKIVNRKRFDWIK